MPIQDRLTGAAGLAPGNGYAHAVTASGPLAFVSGQVGADAEGRAAGEPGDLEAQTRQAMRNLELVLGELGAGWSDVVRFTWYVVDVERIQVIRDVRDEFVRPALGDLANPASTLVQVAGLFRPEFLMEVEAVVALPG
ncbi:Enamine deaminase RidA, house cleaning of reactive enamine intermediates, YjgF/YER057c/UK114 family [Actinopolymorpha cephalotaxi]|uniref:Enamine deaminase RidA (YjgF/YER057c/UK114 family) n=1 Tax=Actinopolymorpha cephalotaxi TaxID=504797 RepID=A0A1I3BGV2_9ACTN|nr:RidA family protein [Actinopolymorpha cephalotaxi]NYH86375.1 enamine deaminase RidA (YjgF/YER057c/UK114 family) [Actinopolymorpha cephalotaxi]SFH61370.1 Enamine deaminase RidA, house cleaning of reactive enamine intermediates, YjgF/YER057c/UK114 family [Actinopolymorpha cephalotaxi]